MFITIKLMFIIINKKDKNYSEIYLILEHNLKSFQIYIKNKFK